MQATTSPVVAGETSVDLDPAPGRLERRTSPVELLWDLVFVFAVPQLVPSGGAV